MPLLSFVHFSLFIFKFMLPDRHKLIFDNGFSILTFYDYKILSFLDLRSLCY